MTLQSYSWAYIQRKAGSNRIHAPPVSVATLFTIAKTWKPPKCPSTEEWIKKMWYIYTMEYYLAIKRNALESVLIRWMNLEPFMQSEVSKKEETCAKPLRFECC